MIDQLDMFGGPIEKTPPQQKQSKKTNAAVDLFGNPLPDETTGVQVSQVEEKKEMPALKKAAPAKLPVIDLTIKEKQAAPTMSEEPFTGPLPSELYAQEVFTLFSRAFEQGALKGQKEDYYLDLYKGWTLPTAEEENQSYVEKCAGDYFEKLARIYVWPTIWRLFAHKMQA